MSSCPSWALLILILSCFLPSSLQAPPATTPKKIGVIRRGVRAPLPIRGDLLSGRDLLTVFIDNEAKKQRKDQMDQSAEPSSMIGEFARIGGRKTSYPEKVFDNSFNKGRRPILNVDDPIFAYRQLPKSRSIQSFHSQNSPLEDEKHSNNFNSLRKDSPSIQTDLIYNFENEERDLKNDLLFQIQNYRQRYEHKERSKDQDEPITENIIALGESRSYSIATNTQPSIKKTFFHSNRIPFSQNRIKTETESPPTQENPEKIENIFTTEPPVTTYEDATEEETFTTLAEKLSQETSDLGKVIAIRVSSSVASSAPNKYQYQPLRTEKILETTLPSTETGEYLYSTPSPLTLLTEDQPQVTAVQRSSFSVEEPSSGQNFDPQVSPVSYHSSISSATSGSSVRFYRDPPSYRRILPNIKQAADEQRPFTTTIETKNTETETTTKKESYQNYQSEPKTSDLTAFQSYKTEPQYRQETRIETVSYHEEAVPSQEQNFGRKTEFTKPLTSPYVSTPSSRLPESPVTITQEGDRTSYQYTNLQGQSYQHVHVTHHNGNAEDGNKDIEKRKPNDGRYYPYQQTTEKNYGVPEKNFGRAEQVYGKPEQNYEIDESVSVMTDGRAHGVQKPHSTTESNDKKKDKNNKFGYVVEGRDFRKYRVEERTPDGFIVGEYGVVSNDGGNLRGVRYTADGTINPRLIYDALVKFLSL